MLKAGVAISIFGVLATSGAGASGMQGSPSNAAIEKFARAAFDSKETPGLSVAVVRDGKIVYASGFGYADLTTKKLATAQTRYAIGSITKQFTAVAILRLAQQQKLSIADALAKYLPQFPNASKTTLRELLNQTSGLHNYPIPTEHPWPLHLGAVSPALVLKYLAADKPDFAPGTKYEYSNANYAVLGAIASKVGGQSYGTLLQTQIFGPLGMSESGYGNRAQQAAAIPYLSGANFQPQAPISLDLYYGAGGIVSTARDLAKWDIALMSGSLLNAASMRELWARGALADGSATEYAMGFVPTLVRGHREVLHNGFSPGAGGYCYNAIFPDDKLAIVVLSNGFAKLGTAGYEFSQTPQKLVGQIFDSYFPAPAFHAAAGEDPAITGRVKEWIGRIQTGTIDHSQLTSDMNAQVFNTAGITRNQAAFSSLGKLISLGYAGKQSAPGITYYTYRAQFENATIRLDFAFDAAGKIAGIRPSPW